MLDTHVTGEQAAARDEPELSFPELVAVLWRRRWLLLLGLAVGVAAGFGVLRLMAPVYTAQAMILIEPRPIPLDDGAAPAAAGVVDSAMVDSQVQVLASRALARDVIAQLGLGRDPELGGGPAPSPDPGAAVAAPGPAPDLVGHFLERLTVRRSGRSQVIAVAWSSAEPAKAAAVANQLVEVFVAGELARKQEATRRASGRLGGQLATARQRLERAEAELQAFRDQAGAALPRGADADPARLPDLQRQLVAANAERSGKEVRIAQVRRTLARGEALPVADGGSPLLQNLQALKAQAVRRRAELEGQLGARHPRLVEARAEDSELDARIGREQAGLLRALESDLQAARAREAVIARGIAELKGAAAGETETARRVGQLEADVALQRRQYQELRERTEASRNREAVQEPDARIISEAVPPESPSRPKPKLILALAATCGLVAALALIYLLEARDLGFRDASEVERELGLAAAGAIPRVDRRLRACPAPHDYAADKPRSRYAEALRDLLATCLAGRDAGPGRVVVLTSALPGEGKSTLALSLGRIAAGDGLRALVIDADLRRPCLRERLGLPPGPGLIEVLRNEARLRGVLASDPRGAMQLIPGSARPEETTRLLASEVMRRVLEGARARYDLILIDTAPVLAVADVRLLAPHADAVYLVAAWGETPRAVVGQATRALREDKARLAGVILARARPRASRQAAVLRRLRTYYAD